MPKKWKLLARRSKDLKLQLLANRGISTSEEIEAFFQPKVDDYQADLTIKGITKAKKRIEEAIEKEEKIFVYGDYDVDGVTASAVVYHGLKSLKASILPYIPHREKEGYGLSKIGIDAVKEKGANLIITVDQGIVAFEQVLYAKKMGIDVIVTDHHSNMEKLPKADVIVHSTKMCGAAVAWSLMKTLVEPSVATSLLQFVAMGTVCDMMPLLGVNRALVFEGLKQLNQTKSKGLRALCLESGLVIGQLTAYDIGHVLGPRLNAIGRLEHALDALRLLCTNDLLQATRLASLLGDTNTTRQRLTTSAFAEAKLQIMPDKKIHVLAHTTWQAGIIGLVASRVCEESMVPVIAISQGENFSKGSARSIAGVNIIEAIRTCSDVLVEAGGHAGAAGFTIETKRIDEFRLRLEKHFERIDFSKLESFLEIEAEIKKDDLDFKLADMLNEFEPFGVANQKPILMSKQLKITDVKSISGGKHLKLKFGQIDGIAFGMGELEKDLKLGQLVDVAYYLEINRFRGKETLQLMIKDLKISDES